MKLVLTTCFLIFGSLTGSFAPTNECDPTETYRIYKALDGLNELEYIFNNIHTENELIKFIQNMAIYHPNKDKNAQELALNDVAKAVKDGRLHQVLADIKKSLASSGIDDARSRLYGKLKMIDKRC